MPPRSSRACATRAATSRARTDGAPRAGRNMFDVGFSELVIIAVVALLVLGPERLPKAARFTGLWVRRARAQWYSVKAELEHDLAADELKRSLRDTEDAMRRAQSELRDAGDSVRQGFEEAR